MNLNESPQVAQAHYDILHKQLNMHRAQEARASLLLKLGFVLTFLLYLAFNMNLYLGDALSWKHYFNDWQATAGFLFMSVIVVLMALFLAWVKHHAYLHFGLYGSIALIVTTVIGFALFAEFFTSSANQDAKSNIQLSGNAAYQQSVNYNPLAGVSIGGGGSALASAQGELAKTRQYLATCKKTCNIQKARVAELEAKVIALQASSKEATQAQMQLAQTAMQANYARQDKLHADSYNSTVVAAAKIWAWIVGGSYIDHIKVAVVLVMLFVATCFEILHHFLSHAKERATNAVMALELEIAKYNAQMSNATATPQPATPAPKPDPNDGQYQDNKAGFGFIPTQQSPAMAKQQGNQGSTGTSYSNAPPALFKYQQHQQALGQEAKQQPFGFIPNRSSNPAPSARLATEPATAPASGQTYWDTDPEIPVQRTYFRNQDTGLDEPVKPYAQGFQEGSQNPMHRVSGEPVAAQSTQGIDSLYPAWVAAIRAGVCRPSAEASRSWIQKRIAPSMTGSKTNDLKRIASMQKGFFARAIREGLMEMNTAYRNGGKKYLWKG